MWRFCGRSPGCSGRWPPTRRCRDCSPPGPPTRTPRALRAITTARAGVRKTAWAHAGAHAPDHNISATHPLIIDLDATLVSAHSEREHAAPTYKRRFGYHPLAAFVDHGQAGTGEPLAVALRPGNAGSNTAADHLLVIAEALAQLPFPTAGRVGHKVLIRTDGAGGTHEVDEYLTKRALSYSLEFGLTATMVEQLSIIPAPVWTPAYPGVISSRPLSPD